MTRRRQPHEDRGAALLIAIGFVMMVSTIAGGLAAMITSGVGNRVSLEQLRNRQYAAEAAIEDSIVTVRQTLTNTGLATTPTCGTVSSGVNNVTIRVDCAPALNVVAGSSGTLLAQRNVVFVACLNTGSACASGAAIIRAQINFEQKGSGAISNTYVQSWSVFG